MQLKLEPLKLQILQNHFRLLLQNKKNVPRGEADDDPLHKDISE